MLAKSSATRPLLPSLLSFEVGFPPALGQGQARSFCLLRWASALIVASGLGFFLVLLLTRVCIVSEPWKDGESVRAGVTVWEGGVFGRGRVEVSNEWFSFVYCIFPLPYSVVGCNCKPKLLSLLDSSTPEPREVFTRIWREPCDSRLPSILLYQTSLLQFGLPVWTGDVFNGSVVASLLYPLSEYHFFPHPRTHFLILVRQVALNATLERFWSEI